MDQQKKNKGLIIDFINTISGVDKNRELLSGYMSDETLMEHILFFNEVLPESELFIEEIMAESNKVMVRAVVKAVHKGSFKGIPPTLNQVELPFYITYVLENGKIISHHLISDQMLLMKQLGIDNELASV